MDLITFLFALALIKYQGLLTNSLQEKIGYIVYCPCMGRFGNQAEQFLGSLLFAKHLDRTLVVPPFIEYKNHEIFFTPFDQYFQIDKLKEYHRVMTMNDFMKISNTVWPIEQRAILCYSARGLNNNKNSCNPFDGNPFKSFWHHFNITTFSTSIFYSPLVTQFNEAKYWKAHYNHLKVLAFVGAPSSFPATPEALPLQQYIQFSPLVTQKANEFRKKRGFFKEPYLAIHIRHGSDWISACQLLKTNEMFQLFSSHQCTERLQIDKSKFKLPFELCYHSLDHIAKDINSAIEDELNIHKIKLVYIATDQDNHTIWHTLSKTLPFLTIITPTTTLFNGKVIQKTEDRPTFIIDSYLLSYSNFFIGNCISSFSAFSSRLRVFSFHLNRTTKFFAQDFNYFTFKDEL